MRRRQRPLPPCGSRLAASLLLCLLFGCTMMPNAVPPSAGDLRTARGACDQQYPRRIGNYLPHAQCVNAAIEHYAMPTARYPDLLRLQAEARTALSDKVDRRVIGANAGAQRMGRIDALVASAERDRSTGNDAAAAGKLAAIQAMLR